MENYSSPTTGEVGRVVEIALGGLAEQEVVEDWRGMSSVDGRRKKTQRIRRVIGAQENALRSSHRLFCIVGNDITQYQSAVKSNFLGG